MPRIDRTAAAGLAVALVIGAALTLPALGRAASPDGAHAYLPLARRLLAEGPAFFSAPEAVMYAPLAYVWPALLGGVEIAVRMANVALFLGTIALAWHAATVAHSRAAGIAAALLVAISPELRLYAADALTEPLFVFLVAAWAAAVAHLARDGEPHPRPWFVLGAVALAAAPLSRPALTLFAPLVAVACSAWAILAPQARREIAWRLAALHGLAVLGPLAWIVHNQLVHGVPSVANGLGGALWLGIDPMVDGFDPLYFGLDFDTGGIARDMSHLSTAGDRILRGGALLQLHDLPLALIAEMMLRKLAAFLAVTGMEPTIQVAPHRAWRLAVLVLGASALAWQRRGVLAWALAAYAAYMTAAHLPLLYNHRYSIGALDLPLALLAGIAVSELAREPRRALVAGCLTTVVVAGGIAMLARAAPGSPHVEVAPGQVLMSQDIAAIEHIEARDAELASPGRYNLSRGATLDVPVRFDSQFAGDITATILGLAIAPLPRTANCDWVRLRYRTSDQAAFDPWRTVRVPVYPDGVMRPIAVGTTAPMAMKSDGVMRIEFECDGPATLETGKVTVVSPRRARIYHDRWMALHPR